MRHITECVGRMVPLNDCPAPTGPSGIYFSLKKITSAAADCHGGSTLVPINKLGLGKLNNSLF